MTTAHRPTWDAAIGGRGQGGNRIVAPSSVRRARDEAQELTMKIRAVDGASGTAKMGMAGRTREDFLIDMERKEYKDLSAYS